MKKIFLPICIVALTLAVCLPIHAETEVYSWFCVHRKDHLQPKADPTVCFIEKYDGIFIDKKHDDMCNDKVIYLTFDAGYENGNIKKILDVLKEENVVGAFFVLGHLIEKETRLIEQMFEDGHLVCNHSFSHKPMIGITEEEFRQELCRLENACVEKTGKSISCFYRPPEGRFDEDTLINAQKMGYKTVFWSFAYDDWDNGRQMSAEKAKKKILENVHNGEIMLLHPTSSTNAEILGDIIKELKAQGYRFGSLEEIYV